MTFKVRREEIGDVDFAAMVEAHCAALREWVMQIDVPPPTAHPYVSAAVRRVSEDGKPDQFIPDYEIVEPPPLTPAELREKAMIASRQQEAKELFELMPPGKVRLLRIQATEAMAVPEADRTAEQAASITDMLAYQSQARAIEKRGAQREAEIEDQYPA